MLDHAAGTGVQVGEKLCQMLLYADDIVLLATSRRALQRQLDVLHDFSTAQHMSVNVAKTKVLVFNGGKHPAGESMYAGRHLRWWTVSGTLVLSCIGPRVLRLPLLLYAVLPQKQRVV